MCFLLNLEYAFYNKATNGPEVIMTDNCDELKDALHAVWPNSRLLLCIFHLMQLCNKYGVGYLIKSMGFHNKIDQVNTSCSNCLCDKVI